MTGLGETPLEQAHRHVVEAEQRREQQIRLITGLCGTEKALAQQALTEIERTLAIARAHRSLLLSLEHTAEPKTAPVCKH
ncbi:hypothetical protein J2X36_005306 [Methylobacterium sp. BE186]|uniref:hypothetical protein n=1 Tax=Methylobacterium sp. BE186 TaxID=2817715 RepID=UPI00285E6F8F|nr:hypothetical protein [Methylobacterium sp. BE186]MDR7040523.1 hypothetical protein [Methylobacterium sp. BE186]